MFDIRQYAPFEERDKLTSQQIRDVFENYFKEYPDDVGTHTGKFWVDNLFDYYKNDPQKLHHELVQYLGQFILWEV